MSRPKRLFTGLLVVILAGAGWAYYQAQTQQTATLARITALEARLMASNQQRARAAKSRWFSIATIVTKNHNLAADVGVLHEVEVIRSRTNAVLDTLHHLRQSWQAGHRSGLRQLPTQLSQYELFIEKFFPDESSRLVPTAGWLSDFGRMAAPPPAALALLTKLETQVRQLEARALQTQAEKVSTKAFYFDKIGAAAIPISKNVAPGSVYQAQLMLLQATSSRGMHFSVNGRALPINPATGQALVQFDVPAARPDQPDTVRAEWRGRVQLPQATGDTTLEITVPYFIIKSRQH